MDVTDTSGIQSIEGDFDYIVHAAAVTSSSYMVSHPVETVDGIVLGTRNILNLALRSEICSMVYISSMEIYGVINSSENERVSEEKLGNVDLRNPRSCYPIGKRMAEHYCFSYYHQFGLPVKIARLAQTFGKGVSKNDQRVFAQFARAVLNEENIVLHTTGDSVGNYCSIDDVVSGIIMLLNHGENGTAYNIVNENATMSIREMAEQVVKNIAHGKTGVEYKIQIQNKFGYAPDTHLFLSAAKIKKLGWKPTKGLMEMYLDLLDDWGRRGGFTDSGVKMSR